MYNQSRNRFSGSRSRSFGGGGRSRRGGFSRYPRKAKTIDPNLFVNKAVVQEDIQEYISTNQFSDFKFDQKLKNNIKARGYETPTPIQDQAIPLILEGRDVIGIAKTGSGKTAAFLIPLINKVLEQRNEKILIVVPTRELAVQIQDELNIFAGNLGIYSALCIGGVGMGSQINALRRNPNFVIGTPGRLMDLARQRRLDFYYFRSIVLDEVDRMLDMGFVTDVKFIVSKLNTHKQSLFFSATMTRNVEEVMKIFVNDPVTVAVESKENINQIDQDVIKVNGRNKIELLLELLRKPEFDRVLVFGRTKFGVEKVSKELDARGIKSASIHGNKNQNQRQKALDQFKQGRVQVLLATDVASRGIDVRDVSHVINFDQPESYEDYIHRIGRTGRANKKGTAITFVD